jgi:hypothetical protein
MSSVRSAATHIFFSMMHVFTSEPDIDLQYWITDMIYKSIGKPINISKNFNIDYPTLIHMEHCKTKGFLSFLILWLVSRRSMTGAEIASELEKRRGKKPSPGTIYPVLKNMKERLLLSIDENKRYSLAEKGKKALEAHLDAFIRTFYDIDEMKSCCCESNTSDKKR